jgi:tRNA(His) 5'-end guanylyltransferase
MDKTTLGDRIKGYEASTESRLLPRLPVVVRLDGRSFSKFTKGMKRPFDDQFRQAMIETTKYLVEQTHAKIGYTQSDEISLVLYTENVQNGSVLFDGRIQKIASNFASMASVKFLLEMQKRFPKKVDGTKTLPSFDCRVFAVPSKTEATNAIYWRVQDCVKNSISMVAQCNFSHKELQGLDGKQMQYKLLTERDINWNNFSSNEKQGTFVRKEKVQVKLDEERLAKIPEDKRPEGGMVTRGKMVEIDMPNFLKVANRNEVIFDGSQPVLSNDVYNAEHQCDSVLY